MMPSLTVIILTRDCEETLPATLTSVSFADEILVVDSGSADRTLDLAQSAGARVVSRPLMDWAEQRNFAQEAARGRWVLTLDSDEVLDAEAAAAIRKVVSEVGAPQAPVGYELLFRNYFLGKPLLHGGLECDFHVRLARRDRSRWKGRVHEQLAVEGRVGRLPGIVHHDAGSSLTRRLEKAATYGAARAASWRAAGRRAGLWRAGWEPVRFFLGRVLIRRGYRDGVRGIAWWWLAATEILLAHIILATGADDRDTTDSVGRTARP